MSDEKCGCRVEQTLAEDFPLSSSEWQHGSVIHYCSLHAAAPKLLEACHVALIKLHTLGQSAGVEGGQLRKAIAAATPPEDLPSDE